MARIPKLPNLGGGQSFLGWIAFQCIRIILGTWLICQAIGAFFWVIWHYSGEGFREFMFRGFINLWYDHSRSIFPWWFFEIPTWQTPYIWIIVGLLGGWALWWVLKNR